VKAPADCRLIGRWRIFEADIWDRGFRNLCGAEPLTITAQGAEIAFGAMEAGLQVEYARDSIGFRWAGRGEGDEVHTASDPQRTFRFVGPWSASLKMRSLPDGSTHAQVRPKRTFAEPVLVAIGSRLRPPQRA